MHTSGLLFLFWFVMLICGIPQFRSEIYASNNDDVQPKDYAAHLIYLIYFPFVIIMFLLNCIADKPAEETKLYRTDVSMLHLVSTTSRLSMLLTGSRATTNKHFFICNFINVAIV